MLSNINIVLVRPFLPENIGMVARAGLNFNINRLSIVNPAHRTWQEKAEAVAVGAFDKLQIESFDSIQGAISKDSYVYGCSARNRGVSLPHGSLHSISKKQFKISGSIAILFGNETNGLNNEEILHCNELLYIPSNKDFSSLNLSHAVVIFLYEYNKMLQTQEHQVSLVRNPANVLKIQHLIEDTLSLLQQKTAYFQSKGGDFEQAYKSLSIIYKKANLNDAEVDMLIGINRFLRG